MIEDDNRAALKQEERRSKRLEYAKSRARLGFKDKGTNIETEGVEDAVFDKLEIDDRKYQKMLEESRERKPIKIPKEVEGISRQEIS